MRSRKVSLPASACSTASRPARQAGGGERVGAPPHCARPSLPPAAGLRLPRAPCPAACAAAGTTEKRAGGAAPPRCAPHPHPLAADRQLNSTVARRGLGAIAGVHEAAIRVRTLGVTAAPSLRPWSPPGRLPAKQCAWGGPHRPPSASKAGAGAGRFELGWAAGAPPSHLAIQPLAMRGNS